MIFQKKYGIICLHEKQTFYKGIIAAIYCKKLTGKGLDKNKKSVLLFTWADEKSFGSDGKFNDRYFTILPNWLKGKGYEVITFCKLHNLKRNYKNACKWVRSNHGKFLLEYSYYKLADYLYPIMIYWRRKNKRFKFNNVSLAGLRLDRLLSYYEKTSYTYNSVLHYCLARRMAENGIRPDIYIDLHENMLPQKMFRLGIRKYCSNTRIVSCQHTPFFPNLLCMYMGGRELEHAPDKLVCSGRAMMDIITNEGFPLKKVVLGPALRYEFLHTVKMRRTNAHDKDYPKVVLVIFPLERKLTEELMAKVFLLLKDLLQILKHVLSHVRVSIMCCIRLLLSVFRDRLRIL